MLEPSRYLEALAAAGEEDDVILLAPTADVLEAARRERADPRAAFVIGDADVLPLPDAYVDEIYGTAVPDELARVRRA